MLETHHIEQIGDTRTDLQTSLDILQIAIETDNNRFVYVDDGSAYHIVANVNENNDFYDVTTHDLTVGTGYDLYITDLTATRVPYITTDGRLTDSERLTYIDNSGLIVGASTINSLAQLDVVHATAAGISIRNTDTTGVGSLLFADSTSTPGYARGWVAYYHTSDMLTLASSSVTRLNIDSSGNIAVGKALTVADSKLEVYGSSGAVDLSITSKHATGTPGMRFLSDDPATQKWIFGVDGTTDELRIESGVGTLGTRPDVVFTATADYTRVGMGRAATILGSGIDIYNATASGRAELYLENGSTTGISALTVRNNVAACDGIFAVYGSADAGTVFGVSRANALSFTADTATSNFFFASLSSGGSIMMGTQNTEAMRISNVLATADSKPQILIGTTSVIGTNTKLHVQNGSVGALGYTYSSGYDTLLLESNNNTYLNFLSPNNKGCGIVFADPDATSPGIIWYDHNTDAMRFATAGAYRWYLDSSGHWYPGADSIYTKWGAGQDCGITYDGTNMVYNSALVGTGYHQFVNNVEVYGASGAVNLSITSRHATGTPGLRFLTDNPATQKFIMGVDSSDLFRIEYGASAIGSYYGFTMDSTGMVALGTAPSTYRLNVYQNVTNGNSSGNYSEAYVTCTSAGASVTAIPNKTLAQELVGSNANNTGSIIGQQLISYTARASANMFEVLGQSITYGTTYGYGGSSTWIIGMKMQGIRYGAGTINVYNDIRIEAPDVVSTTVSNDWCIVSLHAAPSVLSDSLKIGAATKRGTTEGTNHLDLFNGTAPVGTLTNGVSLYSSSGNLYSMEATGLITQLNAAGEIIIPADSKYMKWGGGSDLGIKYDGTYGYIETDLVAPSDLKVDCGAAKTLELVNPVYDDLQWAVSQGKVPAANDPSWEAFTTNTNEYAFDVDDYMDLGAQETPHGWVVGGVLDVHIHVTLKAANASGADRFAKFQLFIAYAASNTSAWSAWTELTTLTGELTIPNGTAATTSRYLDMGNLDLAGYVIGTQIKIRIKRIAATGGTEYASSVFVTQTGMHILLSRIGSRTETAA